MKKKEKLNMPENNKKFTRKQLEKSELKPDKAEHDKEIALNLTTQELYSTHMKKPPEVLKLKLELNTDFLEKSEFKILQQYGKVVEGITREILVPADITLHALSYAIVRAFGWQNSHLHQFRLPTDIFQKLTGGKNKADQYDNIKYDGLYTNWAKLCGLYFRFPCEDFEDLYWDDDYEKGENVKKWFQKKYTGPYKYKGRWEHYHFANSIAKNLMKENPFIRKQKPFEEWLEIREKGEDPNQISDPLIPIEKADIQEISYGFEGPMDELLERIPLIELMIPEGMKEDDIILDKIAFLQKQQERSESNLPVLPVAKELIYAYDYGDDWEVKIKLTECYYTTNSPTNHELTQSDTLINHSGKIEDFLKSQKAFDKNNQKVNQVLARKIATVHYERKPICINVDGLSVMDDVGGIHGYVNFLKTIHGKNEDKKEELKDWAKWMGWTGRINKPATLL